MALPGTVRDLFLHWTLSFLWLHLPSGLTNTHSIDQVCWIAAFLRGLQVCRLSWEVDRNLSGSLHSVDGSQCRIGVHHLSSSLTLSVKTMDLLRARSDLAGTSLVWLCVSSFLGSGSLLGACRSGGASPVSIRCSARSFHPKSFGPWDWHSVIT